MVLWTVSEPTTKTISVCVNTLAHYSNNDNHVDPSMEEEGEEGREKKRKGRRGIREEEKVRRE